MNCAQNCAVLAAVLCLLAHLLAREKKCAQVYTTSFGSTRAHPMTKKGEAHETLSLLFHRDGVPLTMVLDGSKEQSKGDFMRKLREADCHARQTEPYSPWQQALRVVSTN